jgi:hypothetical protein
MRREEAERKKELLRHAAETSERLGLDLDRYSEYLPEELRRELNPRNAGRKAVKWDSAYCALLIERAEEGKTETEFAAELRVSQGLITHWTEVHPNFKQAREVANEQRKAWFMRTYRDAMLLKIGCQPGMMIRWGAAEHGMRDRSETALTGGGGEIPVVKIVERDAGFPSETLSPTAEQAAGAG